MRWPKYWSFSFSIFPSNALANYLPFDGKKDYPVVDMNGEMRILLK